MNKPFKPMLASPVDMSLLRYPCIASAKLDGVRALAMSGQAMSRSMKNIPNKFIQRWFEDNSKHIEGYDGELIIGDPTAKDCYNKTVSGVMRIDGEPDFRYYVFDRWDMEKTRYCFRSDELEDHDRAIVHDDVILESHDDLNEYEEKMVALGYEGVMLRDPASPYKQGRSSAKEGYLLKVKRFSDFEAVITGFQEEEHNANEAFTSEIGRTKRSSHQENMVGKGTLGAWVCEGLTDFEGVEFRVGTGMDAAYRLEWWNKRRMAIGKVIKIKHFAVGAKDAPRHPVLLGWRYSSDM